MISAHQVEQLPICCRHRTNSTFSFVSKRDSPPRSTRGALHGLDLLTFVLDDSTNTAIVIFMILSYSTITLILVKLKTHHMII